MIRKYKFNENFFEKIDSEAKAYFLGLMYSDGWIFNNGCTKGFSIQLQIDDKSILDKFKEVLSSEYPIKLLKKRDRRKDMYRLYCYSSKTANDLINNGCFENKTKLLEWPSDNVIPDSLIHHFIRGYFDGDGCVWDGKRKKMIVKDIKCKSGYRERIVHNVKFTVVGNYKFIIGLQKYLIENLNFTKTKLNISRKDNSIVTLEYSGRKNLLKFFNFIYNNATIYLSRKYNKFNNIFCALNEKSLSETGLIAGKPEMVISSQAVDNTEGSSTIPEMEVELSDSKCPAPNE